MAIVFKKPSDIAAQYLANLKSLKPSVNIDQTDSDWWVRSRVVGGVVAGVYADQLKIANDAFPQSARLDALLAFLITYGLPTQKAAQPAVGLAAVTGSIGTTVNIGLEFVYTPNGNTYQATQALTLAATSALVPVQSVSVGQGQNLLSGAALNIPSAPAGLNSNGSASGNFSDGRDIETAAEISARVLARIQNPVAGGTASDYEAFATAASPSVTSAKASRFPFGLGTVGVYITAGTTDIDGAINSGQPIVRLPSDALLTTVGNYVDALNPLTDCLTMFKPNEVTQNVTINVKYATGLSGSTVITGQTLTLNQLVQREISRALYKTPIGGRLLGTSGYVVASEIEEVVDIALSGEPYTIGSIAQALLDRQVQNLTASGANRLLLVNEIVAPGTITVVEM